MKIYEFVDPDRSQATMDRLAEIHDLKAGRLVCHMFTGCQELGQLGTAMLTALGKDFRLPGSEHNDTVRWRITRAWIVGERITDLIVGPMDELNSYLHHYLYELAEEAQLRLWLLRFAEVPPSPAAADHRARKAVRRLLDHRQQWQIEKVALDAVLQQWTNVASEDLPAAPRSFPDPPQDGFVLFLHRARVDSNPTDYRRIAAAWQRGRLATRRWLGSHRQPDEAALARFLRELATSATSFNEAVCVLRGAQVALFIDGAALLKLDLPRFSRYAQLASRADLERGAGDELRRFRNPARAAACLLRLLSHATAADIAQIQMGDVASDGEQVTVGGLVVTIPPSVAGIIRAQVALRRDGRGTDPDPLFLYDVRGGQVGTTPKTIARWLSEATSHTSLHLAVPFDRRAREDTVDWMQRHGLLLQPL